MTLATCSDFTGPHDTGVRVHAASILVNAASGSGIVEIEVGGATTGPYDRLVVSGLATLSGTTRVKEINGFEPSFVNGLPVLTAGSYTGDLTLESAGSLVWASYLDGGFHIYAPAAGSASRELQSAVGPRARHDR